MADSKAIKTAFERTAKAFEERPSLAHKTGSVRIYSDEGLMCEIESGPWKFKADMPKPVGGDETAPTPGVYEAGALGSCIAILVRMWGAKLDVPIDSVEIEVDFEADKRFLFMMDVVPSRWSAIRYHITVESTAPKEEVMRVLDRAHQQSHVRGDFEYAHFVERKVTINNFETSTKQTNNKPQISTD